MSTKTIVFGTIALLAIALYTGFNWFVKDAWKAFPSGPTMEAKLSPRAAWQDFTPPTGKFKVSLPLLPQHATESVTDPLTKSSRDYEMYVSQEADGTIYMISSIQFRNKRDLIDSEGLLKATVSDMMKANPDNTLVKSQSTVFNGFPAQEFVIQNPQMTLEGRAFIDQQTLYILTTIENGKNYKPDDFNYFIKSFQLNPSK